MSPALRGAKLHNLSTSWKGDCIEFWISEKAWAFVRQIRHKNQPQCDTRVENEANKVKEDIENLAQQFAERSHAFEARQAEMELASGALRERTAHEEAALEATRGLLRSEEARLAEAREAADALAAELRGEEERVGGLREQKRRIEREIEEEDFEKADQRIKN